MFGGIHEHEWDRIGDISLSVNGKMDNLSPVVQALVSIGLADGARLSTHSAIVGASKSPFPQFGAFSSVDDSLSTLGRRRKDAVTTLNAKAMAYLDLALYSPEGIDPSTKLQLLWIATAVMVETPESRSWCREMSFRCAKYIFECLGREGLGNEERMRLYEQSYMVVMWDSVRSASFGLKSSLTRQEYITAVPYMAYPPPPVYYPTLQEYDSFFISSSLNFDFTPLFTFLERLFMPWRVRFIKVIFVFTYGQDKMTLTHLVTLMWEWMDQIWNWGGGILSQLLADPRFEEVEKIRNTPRWESWVLLQMTWKHFFIVESIYASLLLGCHRRLVKDEGEVKKHLLARSQKRCYEALRRMDFICGLREVRRDFHEYDAFLLSIQLIVQLPENGPCSSICLQYFPHLLKAFEFMSFSNAEWGDFLTKHSKRGLTTSAPELFADQTSVCDLLPFALPSLKHSPTVELLCAPSEGTLSPFYTSTTAEDQASQLVGSALATLSEASLSAAELVARCALFDQQSTGESSCTSPSLFSADSSSKNGADYPASTNSSTSSSFATEASITSEIESIAAKLFVQPLEAESVETATSLVQATLRELSESEEVSLER